MKHRNILIFSFLFFFLALISCFNGPRIEFNEMSYDFGNVKQNSELKHIFIFKNTGNSILKIEKVKPS